MDVFIARQPIFDKFRNTSAYELLFRNNNYINASGVEHAADSAPTVDVIVNSFCNLGIFQVTDGKTAFINFNKSFLTDDLIYLLPPELVTIEILEDVDPSEDIIDVCRRLKELGYTIALDDFLFEDKYSGILEYIDIIKIDFILTKGIERKKVIDKINSLTNRNIKFLAEKVETDEDVEQALRYGYTLFQGYFFCKPIIMEGKEIDPSKINCIKLFSQINKPDLTIDELEELIKKDVSISVKLLTLINSVGIGLLNKVKSVRQAIMLLGKNNILKWLYLILLRCNSSGNNDEIIKMCLNRAKYCELLSLQLDKEDESYNAYFLGIVSLMDVLLKRKFEDIFKVMYLPDDVKDALLGKENNLKKLLDLAVCYEKSDWVKVDNLASSLNIRIEILPEIYIKTLEWTENAIKE